MRSKKYLVLAVLAGIAISCVLAWSLRKNQEQERTIAALQASLDQGNRGIEIAQPQSRAEEPARPAIGRGTANRNEPTTPAEVSGSYQVLKELEEDSATDARSSAEKLQALLADDATEEEVAIASRFIFNKAADAQGLPDYALQELYANQANPDLRRVIAQVMSQRGDDSLIADQVADAQATLKSSKPRDRLAALGQLGKLHSVQSVDAIAPSLQDSDSTVRVAALFALRDNGNQKHVSLAEPLTRDPDASVRELAGNVVSALKNLSSSARTSYSRADIEAELPPIANP